MYTFEIDWVVLVAGLAALMVVGVLITTILAFLVGLVLATILGLENKGEIAGRGVAIGICVPFIPGAIVLLGAFLEAGFMYILAACIYPTGTALVAIRNGYWVWKERSK